jgi:transketolase
MFRLQGVPIQSEDWQQEARRVAHQVRRRVLKYTLDNNGGYLSQACSAAELLATLYLRVLKLGPSDAPMVPPPFSGVPGPDNLQPWRGARYNGPCEPSLDRFFFSPVHYALVLYSTLIEVGRMAPEGLAQFNRDGSTVEMIGAEHSPGIEVTSGSLAQTLSQAGGVALARKLRGESGRVWVMMSDGEFQEGQTWEALAAIAFHKLDNLGVFVDVNGQQCDGPMDTVMNIEPLIHRLRAFGVAVTQLDGHDVEALATASENTLPRVILARTDPCRGMPLLQSRAPRFHYVRFKTPQEHDAYRAFLESM